MKNSSSATAVNPSMALEFKGAELGDKRRTDRLVQVASNAQRMPSASLPNQAKISRELEGTYRLLNNSAVVPEAAMAAHQACTLERAKLAKSVLVLHDTTSFCFGGAGGRAGMGPLNVADGALGFFAHFSVCVSRSGEPLGAAGLYAWARRKERKPSRRQRISQSDPDREALRWQDAVHQCGELLRDVPDVVHVMDREGDCMELLADMVEHGHRFVVRLAHDRRLDANRKAQNVPKLYDSLAAAPFFLERRVPLVRRGSSRRGVAVPEFGQTASRDAFLTVRAGTFVISTGNGSSYHLPDRLELHFVEVVELDPPVDMEPVHWRLATTESL